MSRSVAVAIICLTLEAVFMKSGKTDFKTYCVSSPSDPSINLYCIKVKSAEAEKT